MRNLSRRSLLKSGVAATAGLIRPNAAFHDSNAAAAFGGLCMIFVQSTKQAGEVQVAASASSLQSARLAIPSRAANPRRAMD
jgi:hypothetical protein